VYPAHFRAVIPKEGVAFGLNFCKLASVRQRTDRNMKKTVILTLAIAVGGAVQANAAKIDFVKQIQPILKESCYECHGAKKKKGGLRVDTKEFAFEEDYMIVPGKPDESELYARVVLPADHDDIMPPKGDPLPKKQQDLLKQWIMEGAHWPDGLKPETAEKKADGPMDRLTTIKPKPAETKAIAELGKLGVSVRPVAKDLLWKTANLRSLDLKDVKAALGHLSKVETMTDLNLASRELTDADLKHIAPLKNMTRLHLERNKITDAGLAHIKGMTHLHYLNLYGTEVSDKGLSNLHGMKNLKKVYLWQTKVTDGGLAALKKALPGVQITMGWKPAPVAKKEEPKKTEAKKSAPKKKDEKKK
jgi:hypothetical protein